MEWTRSCKRSLQKKIPWGVEMLGSRITLETEAELYVNLYILDNVHLIILLGDIFVQTSNSSSELLLHSIFKDYFKA